MFHYVRMEDMVPENHLLRLVDKYVDFSFILELKIALSRRSFSTACTGLTPISG
jgi:hypothetical protein